MHLIVSVMRRPITTLMLIVALASGGVLVVSKVRSDIFPPPKTPTVNADLGSTAARARQMNWYTVGQFGSYFPKQDEQPNQRRRKIVLTSPKAMDVTLTQRHVCQIHSQRHINICAFDSGCLGEVSVKDGQAVKKGDVMFKIVMAKARPKADLAKAGLDFTNVIAPFDGIVGRLHEHLGSQVKERDVLTTLSDNRVMWVYFNVPETQYLDYMANRKQHAEDKIELLLANQTKFSQPGKIGAIEAEFNNETGNIAFRADFPNPDGLLRHGQTGTILIHRKLHDATVIPMRATYELLDKRFVYIVDKGDVVHRREIIPQYETEDIYVIKKGVGVGDRVVLEGIRQIRDGEKVEYELRPPDEVMRRLKNQAE